MAPKVVSSTRSLAHEFDKFQDRGLLPLGPEGFLGFAPYVRPKAVVKKYRKPVGRDDASRDLKGQNPFAAPNSLHSLSAP